MGVQFTDEPKSTVVRLRELGLLAELVGDLLLEASWYEDDDDVSGDTCERRGCCRLHS